MMRVRAGERSVSHPDLLAGKTLAAIGGGHRLPEQRPLHAKTVALRVLQVRGKVPPFDAVVGMSAVIGGKHQRLAANDLRKAAGIGAEAGEALGVGWDGGDGGDECSDEGEDSRAPPPARPRGGGDPAFAR